jgi:beta-fructofuranosidase
MSDDGQEKTTVYYEPGSDTFGVAGDFAKRDGSPDKASAQLAKDDRITVRIFLDHSVLEAFVNGRPITERLYPNPDSQAVDVFAEGGRVRVESLDVWQMKSIW